MGSGLVMIIFPLDQIIYDNLHKGPNYHYLSSWFGGRDKFLHGNPVSLRSLLGEINDGYQAREWLVHNVKGIGYKEAGHFSRNIGFTQDLAILDRHILKNLKKLEPIDGVPVDPLN